MDKHALGRRLRAARRERGLTAEQVAERVDVNATYLRQIEGVLKTPSLPVFVALCDALGASPGDLLRDQLPHTPPDGLHELEHLWSEATPSQRELAAAMLAAALRQVRGE